MNLFDLLINYILVIIYNSFIGLTLVLLVLYFFKLKESNIRILLLFIPLIKPFLAISESFYLNKELINKNTGVFGLRFLMPNTFLNRFDSLERSPIDYSNLNTIVILTIIICIVIVLMIRWFCLYIFYKKLSYDDIVTEKEVPNLYIILNKLSIAIKIKNPLICLTHKKILSPFVIGIRNHIIVLSPALLDRLNKYETEILLLHELAHIKRRDNLIGWFALILKDLLFFNPFSYIAYYLIKIEQEKGSDSTVSNLLEYEKSDIAVNTINLIIKINNIGMANKTMLKPLITSSLFTPFKRINFKILKIRIKSIICFDKKNIAMVLPMRILMFFLFFILLCVQIIFIIKTNNAFILLR
ncbi:MAG: hypothetical protein FJW68_05705 [Actinobacteria bacterium]|nr:hypothetical protein [Actinomycetota bacterium]